MKMKAQWSKTYGMQLKALLRGKFIEILPQKIRKKSQINNASLYLKQIEEEEEMKPKFSRRKRIMKITAEINEIQTKKTTVNINEAKSCSFEKITLS